jgi:hypothetical protein
LGVPLSGLSRVIVGAHTNDDHIVVVLTKPTVTAEEIKKNRKTSFTEVKVGKYVIYDAKEGPFCVVNDHTLLTGSSSEALKKVLERDKAPEIATELQALFKQVAGSKAISVAFGPQEVKEQAGKLSADVAAFKPPPELQPLFDSQAFALQIELTSGVEVTASLQCKNAADAEALKKTANDFLTKAKAGKLDQPAKDALQAIKLGVSGDTLNVTVAASDDTVAGLVQSATQLVKGFMMQKKD